MAMRIIGEATEYRELVALYRRRVAELGLTYEVVDDLAGLPARYLSKVLGPSQIKRFGNISLGATNGALGVKILMVVDDAAVDAIKDRWPPQPKAVNDNQA